MSDKPAWRFGIRNGHLWDAWNLDTRAFSAGMRKAVKAVREFVTGEEKRRQVRHELWMARKAHAILDGMNAELDHKIRLREDAKRAPMIGEGI